MKQQKRKTHNQPRKDQHTSSNVICAPGDLMKWTFLIAALTFVAFSPALSNEFVNWDDFNYIRDNHIIRDLSIKNIMHIFNLNTYVLANYHPLTVLSYAIEYKLVSVQPFLYHLDNLLIHILSIFLMMRITWHLTKEFYTTLLCAALFAMHPMRVESVVWAAERKDVLYTCFFLASWLFYIKFLLADNGKSKLLVISLLFFVCSLLSKGQAVVLPVVFILTNYWFDGKWELKNLKVLIPYFILSLIFGVIAIHAQAAFYLTEQRLASLPLWERILVANYNLMAYTYKFVIPWDMSCFYGYFPKAEMWKLYIAPTVVIIGLALLIWKFRTNKTVVFGCLFFLLTIIIVIQLLPVGNVIIADRYTYIPYIGFIFITAKLLNDAIVKNKKRSTTLLTIISIVLVVFAVKSYLQAKTWKSSETIWLNALQYNDKEPTAYLNLGSYYYSEGGQKEKALILYQKCIENKETYPELWKAYDNIGVYYLNAKRYDLALENLNESLTLAPNYLDGVFNRGLTYSEMGQTDKAIADFTNVIINIDKTYDKAWFSRGLAYQNIKRWDEAIADYEHCIRLNPEYADAYINLGNVYFMQGNYDSSILNYSKALKVNSESGNAWLNRSKAYAMKKDFTNAASDVNEAIKRKMPVDEQYMQLLKQGLADGAKQR